MHGTSISRPRGAAEGEGVDPAPPCRSADDRTSIPRPSVARCIAAGDLTLRSAHSPAQRTLHGRPPPSAPSLGAGVSAPGERGGRCGGVRGEGKNHIPEGNPLPIFTSRPAPRRPGPRSPAHRRYLSAGSRRRGPASSPQVAAEAAAAPPRARPRRSARPAPRLRPAPFAPSRPAAPRPSPSPKRTNQSEQVAR